jgi:hypothetical protein
MMLLHLLRDEAAGPGGFTWASFMNGPLRELSLCLCRGNFSHRISVGMLARSCALSVPMDECVE